MTIKPTNYWFPAKRYGWGWGMPSVWQGWAVLIAFGVLLAIGAIILPPKPDALRFVLYTSGLSVVLVGICYLKGEPPSWR